MTQLNLGMIVKLTLHVSNKRVIESNMPGNLFEADIQIPNLFHTSAFKYLKPVLALRLRLDDYGCNHFPYVIKENTGRYLGIRIPIYKTVSKSGYNSMGIEGGFYKSITKNKVTGTLEELKTQIIWT